MAVEKWDEVHLYPCRMTGPNIDMIQHLDLSDQVSEAIPILKSSRYTTLASGKFPVLAVAGFHLMKRPMNAEAVSSILSLKDSASCSPGLLSPAMRRRFNIVVDPHAARGTSKVFRNFAM